VDSREDLNQPHAAIDERLRDQALDYVLRRSGAVRDADYAGHLEICAACREEVDDLRSDVGLLVFLAPEAKRRSTLLARMRGAQPWKSWPDQPAASMTYIPASGEWEKTAHCGVFARRLFVDREHDRVTMLVRMDAGSSYPAHRHGGAEECYVVAGDLVVGVDLQMHSGDYQRCEQGSEHPIQRTEGGCLLLISSSLHDQLREN